MNDTYHRSHLFTLRLWPAPRAGGEIAWRGQVTHALSGETRYFREWQTLLDFLVGACSVPFTGQSKRPIGKRIAR